MGQNARSYEYSVQISAFQTFQIKNGDLKTIFHCSRSTIHRAAETAVHKKYSFFFLLACLREHLGRKNILKRSMHLCEAYPPQREHLFPSYCQAGPGKRYCIMYCMYSTVLYLYYMYCGQRSPPRFPRAEPQAGTQDCDWWDTTLTSRPAVVTLTVGQQQYH